MAMVHDNKKRDSVTGMLTYGDFIDIAKKCIGDCDDPSRYVLVSTDISNFKYVNRICGYDKANRLLISVAGFLEDESLSCIASSRTHSDHFISLYELKGSREDFIYRIDAMSRRFERSNSGDYPSIMLHLNNGIYFFEQQDDDILYCMDKANVARREAKGNYLLSGVLFSDDMLNRKEADAKILALFDNALHNDRIKVLYQPKMDIVEGRVKGVEALSRLYDEDDSLISPEVFIPVLENSGKVIDLDFYVMRKAFAAIRNWIDKGYEPVVVSINLSRMNFYGNRVADRIFSVFSEYGIPAECVEFELTESLFVAESDVIIEEVNKLRTFGFKVSMDDFGVGYSNLNSLGELPVDVIKFDKGFVKSSMATTAGYQIFLSLVNVFKKINYDVICEGVETKADEKMIFDCGCDMAQGFLYDRPMELSDFEAKYFAEKYQKM